MVKLSEFNPQHFFRLLALTATFLLLPLMLSGQGKADTTDHQKWANVNCGTSGCMGTYQMAISPHLRQYYPIIRNILEDQCQIHSDLVDLSEMGFRKALVSKNPMIFIFDDLSSFPVDIPDLNSLGELYTDLNRHATVRASAKLTDENGTSIEKEIWSINQKLKSCPTVGCFLISIMHFSQEFAGVSCKR